MVPPLIPVGEGGVVSSTSRFKEDGSAGRIITLPLENKEVGCGIDITISLSEKKQVGWHHPSSLQRGGWKEIVL